MTKAQQFALGGYLNLMNSSTRLLVNPIMGLQPAFTEEKLSECIESMQNENSSSDADITLISDHKELIKEKAVITDRYRVNRKVDRCVTFYFR